jgi:putative phosphoesterase
MTRLGVLSDTHIPVVAPSLPDELLGLLEREGVSLILHAGDLVVPEVIDQLLEAAPVKAVAGNMDVPVLQESLPSKDTILVEDVRIGLIHGWGPSRGLSLRVWGAFSGDEVDCVVFGHSHLPHNEELKGVLLFNPGTPTDSRFSPQKSLGILEIDGGQVKGRHLFLS